MKSKSEQNYIVTKVAITCNADLILGEEDAEKIKKALSVDDVDERLYFFHKYFDVRCDVRAGDVYLTQFQNSIGTELSGDHFAVAIINSTKKNRNVMIIPLTSAKEGKHKNPRNSVFLGTIPGINNGKESIALINQVQSVDKKRFLKLDEMYEILRLATENSYERNSLICEINKVHYRLTRKQYNELCKCCQEYMQHNGLYSEK
ncbi:MAG: type II toxin-antitoxin system PemK/MazF family toxin [Bacilli bacterium]|nr:type II toxin-antitoxin system PemK/MazF family toxin [Bacilli bacterium]